MSEHLPNFTIRKGDTLYIKVTVGHAALINGYQVEVIRVNKKEGELHSIRVNIIKSFRLDKGISAEDINVKRTFDLGQPAYEIFQTKSEFIKSMEMALRNVSQICLNSINELYSQF